MNRKRAGIAVAVMAAAVLLAACDDSSTDTSGTPSATTPTSARVATLLASDLRPALLDADAFPAGYRAMLSTPSEDLWGCSPLDRLVELSKGEPAEQTEFVASATEPSFTETISIMTGGHEPAQFAEIRAAFDACPTTVPPSLGGAKAGLTTRGVDGIGDQAISTTMSVTAQGVPFTVEMLLVRVGGTVVEMDQTTRDGSRPDPATTFALATKAVAKVRAMQLQGES